MLRFAMGDKRVGCPLAFNLDPAQLLLQSYQYIIRSITELDPLSTKNYNLSNNNRDIHKKFNRTSTKLIIVCIIYRLPCLKRLVPDEWLASDRLYHRTLQAIILIHCVIVKIPGVELFGYWSKPTFKSVMNTAACVGLLYSLGLSFNLQLHYPTVL